MRAEIFTHIAASRYRSRNVSITVALELHLLLLFGWKLQRQNEMRDHGTTAHATMVWLSPTLTAAINTSPASVRVHTEPTPSSGHNKRNPSIQVKNQPTGPADITPTSESAAKSNDLPALPVTGDLLQQSRSTVGKIDKELRKEFPQAVTQVVPDSL